MVSRYTALAADTCKHYGIKAEAEHWYQHEADQVLDMRNRDPHRENVKNILAISLPIMTMQHIRESPPASHAMRKSAWNDRATVLRDSPLTNKACNKPDQGKELR